MKIINRTGILRACNLDSREAEFLKKNNYILAAAAGNKLASSADNVYNIPRLSVGDGFFFEELCHMLGFWQPIVLKLKRVLSFPRKRESTLRTLRFLCALCVKPFNS